MRNTISYCYSTLMFGIPVGGAHILGRWISFIDPYPTPELVSQAGDHTDISIRLILGAALIVVVILGGVAFRRMKS